MAESLNITSQSVQIVGIGASTGAPKQLQEIIKGLPADLSVPVLIAQHMPPNFTESFATRLAQQSAVNVVHAEEGMPIYPGTVYVGRGHMHMRVGKRKDPSGIALGSIRLSEEPRDHLYRPSTDELFDSISELFGKYALGVVMTGMGRDGAKGAASITAKGGIILTQTQETCAVYGMPKACVEAGASSAAMSPDEIRTVLRRLVLN